MGYDFVWFEYGIIVMDKKIWMKVMQIVVNRGIGLITVRFC